METARIDGASKIGAQGSRATFRRAGLALAASALVGAGLATPAGAAPLPFTPGNLVVYRVGDGTTALVNTGNAVFLDEYTPAVALVQSVPLPTTSSGANKRLVASGTATSEGLLTLSPNGQYLALTGYDSPLPGAASLSGSAVPRVVGLVDGNASVNTSTAPSDFATGNNPRSAVTTDGSSVWMTGGAGGVRYATAGTIGTSTQVSGGTLVNFRQVNIFANQLYASDQSGTTNRLSTVGTGLPTTGGQPVTNLPGFSTSTGNPYSFFFTRLQAGTGGPDTVYLADETANQIQKWSLIGGSWTLTGGITAAAVRGLAASVSGTTVTLYGSTGASTSTGGGTIYAAVDATGYGASATGTASSLVTLPASSNKAFRGIAFAPTTVPGALVPESPLAFLLPVSGALLAGAAVTLRRRRPARLA